MSFNSFSSVLITSALSSLVLGLAACEPATDAHDAAVSAPVESRDATSAQPERALPQPDTERLMGDAGSAAWDAQRAQTTEHGRADAALASDAHAGGDARVFETDAGMLAGDAAATPDGGLCGDGFPRGARSTSTRLVQKLNPGPEGVGVCPDGDVLASAGEVLWRLPLGGGEPEKLSTLPGRSLQAIVCVEKERVFVADISPMWSLIALQEPPHTAAVMLVEERGAKARALTETTAAASQLTGFNGLLRVPGLGLYTTDMMAGVIVRYQEHPDGRFTSARVAEGLMGANGLAYDPRKRLLYVVQTGMVLTPDRVWAFEVRADGSLGERTELWASYDLNGSDGLAIDENGVLYRADQLHGVVVRMSDQSVVAKVPNPASLAFRGGTLFVSDFKMLGTLQDGGEGGVYAVDLGVCGGDLRAE